MYLRGEYRLPTQYGWTCVKVALACACAQVCVTTANAAGECVIDRGGPVPSTYAVRLFGGAIRVPVEYTLYGDSALARRAERPPVLELHDLSPNRGGGLASISIGNVTDAGDDLERTPVLCTLGALTVRQEIRPGTTFTVIQDDQHFVTLYSGDAKRVEGSSTRVRDKIVHRDSQAPLT